MAGKRQHHITRHLMSGFAFQKGRNTRTYLYRKDVSEGRLTSINDIGCESYFYSADHPGSLDEKITDYEQRRLVKTIDLLREQEPWGTVPPDEVAEAVSHFVIRGDFVRKHMGECVAGLLDGIRQAPQLVMPTGEQVIEAAQKELQERTGMRSEVAMRVARMIESRSTAGPYGSLWQATLRRTFGQMMNQLAAVDLGDVAADAQKKVLAGLLSKPDPKTEIAVTDALKRLHWRTVPCDNAVLPDCVSISLKDGQWRQTSIWSRDGKTGGMEAVMFPVSAKMICVGTKERQTGSHEPAWLSDYNTNAARLSRTYFIAESPVDELHELIGQDSDKLAQELVGGFFLRKTLVRNGNA